VLAVLATASCTNEGTNPQADVAARGAQVMPFDLDATTHIFTKTDNGGTQRVVADNPGDATQVQLIREHLRTERENFARGDFDDPARIHGMDMPGVDELAAGYTRVSVTYTERPDGAELSYTTDDPQLVDAVHEWFDRQVADHGNHAQAG
jgi:hypothetical protein